MDIKKMTQSEALEIVDWHYEDIYAFYDMEADLEEFIDESKRGDSYYSVFSNNQLIGYFSFTEKVDEIIIGLGLRPDLTGKGEGTAFLKFGIDFIKNNYKQKKLSLSVATFNKRAIKVYQKVGFIPKEIFLQKTNGGEYEFMKMELEIYRVNF